MTKFVKSDWHTLLLNENEFITKNGMYIAREMSVTIYVEHTHKISYVSMYPILSCFSSLQYVMSPHWHSTILNMNRCNISQNIKWLTCFKYETLFSDCNIS